MATFAHVARYALVPLLAIAAAGCGGGGDSDGGSDPVASNPGDGGSQPAVAFSAQSDDLTPNPFGEEMGERTFQSFNDGVLSDWRLVKDYTPTIVNGVAGLDLDVTYINAQGQPSTSENNLLHTFFVIAEAILEGIGYTARADDGGLYVISWEGGARTLVKSFPATAVLGTEWTVEGNEESGIEGQPPVPVSNVHRVMAVDAVAPRSLQLGCILLRIVSTSAGTSKTEWRFYKPGTGLVETTDTDPAQDQSQASGKYLVPNIG
jgi:hypothetical protein